MMRRRGKICTYLCIGLLMGGLLWGYRHEMDGFNLHGIASQLPYDQSFDVTPPSQMSTVFAAFDQPYSYLGKGCQMYAFVSADGQYVLKFFKHCHLRPWTELNQIPLFSCLRKWGDQKIERRWERRERLFTSCKLAYERLAEESGLLCVHLNRTPLLERDIVLIDRIGFKHRIWIDDYEFLLQRKMLLWDEVFVALVDQEDFCEQSTQRIDAICELYIRGYQYGIQDEDYAAANNIGFASDGTACFIDIGRLHHVHYHSIEEQRRDLERRLGDLQVWVEEHYPQYKDAFSQICQTRLQGLGELSVTWCGPTCEEPSASH